MRTATQGTGGGSETVQKSLGQDSYTNFGRYLQDSTALDLQTSRVARTFGLPEATARTVAELHFAAGGAA